MTENYSNQAIQAVLNSRWASCKFLSANDTGLTGGHQSGIYIAKSSYPILFDELGQKGTNKEKWVKIKWQNDWETESRFIYYGRGTRDEYRITNFGKDFPFLRPDYTGALFVLTQDESECYNGFILNTEEEIDQFLDAFGLTPAETNCLIDIGRWGLLLGKREEQEINSFINGLTVDFPTSEEMSAAARTIEGVLRNHAELIQSNPDRKILSWTEMEYKLFRALEYNRYKHFLFKGFYSVDDFVNAANMVLNRRKSRAGKSLEHHLAAIFDGNGVKYTAQAVTEGNKRPDFIFPSQKAYHDITFPTDSLISLAAKTTCKDRWRQIINEADRLRNHPKYLFTLQQGISPRQMDEMQEENVVLVVPREYIDYSLPFSPFLSNSLQRQGPCESGPLPNAYRAKACVAWLFREQTRQQ